MKKGISLVEILIAVSILSVFSSLSISIFSRLANTSTFEKDIGSAISFIDRAREEAVTALNNVSHSVFFTRDKVGIFKTTSYSPSNLESTYSLSGKSYISHISLSNGTTTLYFEKLTGYPSATGTITFSLFDNSQSKIVTIYGTGVVDVQ